MVAFVTRNSPAAGLPAVIRVKRSGPTNICTASPVNVTGSKRSPVTCQVAPGAIAVMRGAMANGVSFERISKSRVLPSGIVLRVTTSTVAP